MIANGGKDGMTAALEMIDAQSNGTLPKIVTGGETLAIMWQRNTAIQEKYNDPAPRP